MCKIPWWKTKIYFSNHRNNLSHWPLYPEVSKMKSINCLPDFSRWHFLKKIIKVNVTDCGYGKTEDRSFFLILFLNQIGALCLLYLYWNYYYLCSHVNVPKLPTFVRLVAWGIRSLLRSYRHRKGFPYLYWYH